jgi:hypothetical protein
MSSRFAAMNSYNIKPPVGHDEQPPEDFIDLGDRRES